MEQFSGSCGQIVSMKGKKVKMGKIKKKHVYSIHVCRIGYAHRDIDVDATNKKEAAALALEKASSLDFSEKDAEYTVEGSTRLK